MTDKPEIRWGLGQRFEFLEWRLYWTGRVNRRDLEESFGVSTQQASLDLKAYQEAADGNITYDPTEKAYVSKDTFRSRFLTVSADRYLLQVDAILNGAIQVSDTWFASLPPVSVAQNIARSVEPNILREILRAIETRSAVEIVYQSLTNTRNRTISPHSIAFDGHRWHARSWCGKKQEFRDFVLTRILSIGQAVPSDANPSDDMEWNTLVELNLVAHPLLSGPQKSAIEHDFGMRDGTLKVKTRLALAFYLIRRLNLDLEHESISPERKQIVLTNLSEIESARMVAKDETQLRVSQRRTASN